MTLAEHLSYLRGSQTHPLWQLVSWCQHELLDHGADCDSSQLTALASIYGIEEGEQRVSGTARVTLSKGASVKVKMYQVLGLDRRACTAESLLELGCDCLRQLAPVVGVELVE